MPIVDHRTSLYDGQLEFADANVAGLITGGIRAATATDGGVQKHYRVFRTKNSKFRNWHGRQFLNRLTVCDLEKYLKSVYLAASESDDEKTNERAFGKDFVALYFGTVK